MTGKRRWSPSVTHSITKVQRAHPHLTAEQVKSRRRSSILDFAVYVPMRGGPLGGCETKHFVIPDQVIYRRPDGEYRLTEEGDEFCYQWVPSTPATGKATAGE